MNDLTLSIAMGTNPLSEPVLSGTVKPEGIAFHATCRQPSEFFGANCILATLTSPNCPCRHC